MIEFLTASVFSRVYQQQVKIVHGDFKKERDRHELFCFILIIFTFGKDQYV